MTNKKKLIKVGYLLSYDYKYIFKSLELVYDYSDEIVISYDINGKTWSGNDFTIPEIVFEKIKKLDKDQKIHFYADSFYIDGTPPMELETRQRKMMAEFMGKGGWHIQIDSDEYAYDFQKLTSFLRKNAYLTNHPEKTPIQFLVNLVVLFKKDDNGFFVVHPFSEKCFFITNLPSYTAARVSQTGNILPLNYYIIHQSWARENEEIAQKINNWGHVNDFDVYAFHNEWKKLNKKNYLEYINFHPLTSSTWEKLEFFEAKDISEFIKKFEKKYPQSRLKLPVKLKRKIKYYLKNLF